MAMAMPEANQTPASTNTSNPKLLIEDGFNAMAAGPSDDPEQQALLALHYLTGRAHASALGTAAPTASAVAEASTEPPAANTSRSIAELAASAPLRHTVLLDVAAALGGITSIAAAFTFLSGRPLRRRSAAASDQESGSAMPVPVALLEQPKRLAAQTQASLDKPMRPYTPPRAEHVSARRSRPNLGRAGTSRTVLRPKTRTQSP
jgi:hypothetical protein